MFHFTVFPFFSLFGWLIPFIILFLGVRFLTHIFRGTTRHINSEFRPNSELPSRMPREKNMETRIFALANRLKGRITVSDIVVDTGLSIKEAEEIAERMVDGTHVRMEVNDNGVIFYEFPEILARHGDES